MGGRRALRVHVVVILGLLALSVAAWWRVWITGAPGSSLTCQCGDPGLSVWFLAWLPWSIDHLHNPFLSHLIYAGQGGANTMDTTSLGPSLPLWPITAIFGPVAAFNVLVTLVPVINGWSMFVLLRKLTAFLPGQVLGALLYGFSPFVVSGDPFGDFNASMIFFAPLAIWCVYDLLIDRRHSPIWVGVGLGALGVVQFFVGPELLATAVLMGLVGGLIVIALAGRRMWERRAELLSGLGVAALIWVVVLAYPAWYLLDGPRHIVGAPWPGITLAGANWNGLVDPGAYGRPSAFLETVGYFGGAEPQQTYLGVGMLVLLLLALPLWRRRKVALALAGVGIVAWLFSLGYGLTGWRPWRLLAHVPVLSKAIPLRFTLYVDLVAAVLLAISLDLAWAHRQRAVALLRRWRPRLGEHVWAVLCCAVAVAALIPTFATYQVPYALSHLPVPRWFTNQARTLRPGTHLLTLPYPSAGLNEAMAWQAEDNFRFAMAGGYAQVPGRDGRSELVDPPHGVQGLLRRLSFPGYGPEPVYSDHSARAIRAALIRWGVQAIVVTTRTGDLPNALRYLSRTLGRPPQRQADAWVWRGPWTS